MTNHDIYAPAWAVPPHPFAPMCSEAPGTAHEPDDLTPAEYERRWVSHAMEINPDFRHQAKGRRGRKARDGEVEA